MPPELFEFGISGGVPPCPPFGAPLGAPPRPPPAGAPPFMLPVPPFDGSRIALLFLPQRLYFRAMKYERYIMLAVLALVFLGLLDAPLSWLVNGMWRLMLHLTGFAELLWGY